MTEKMKKLFYLFSLIALASFHRVKMEIGLFLIMERPLSILLINIR